jgi:hypothetical protein
MTLTQLKRRQADATAISKRLNSVWKNIDKIPSFAGKARLMDKLSWARNLAEGLVWDLTKDLETAQGK